METKKFVIRFSGDEPDDALRKLNSFLGAVIKEVGIPKGRWVVIDLLQINVVHPRLIYATILAKRE